MRIICEQCGRKMEIGELLPNLIVCCLKKVAPIISPLVIKAFEYYWSSPTRSFGDSSMAGIANLSEIKCPHCKKYTCWNPAPEIDKVQEQNKKEKSITNL